MKKILLIALCSILVACGGGGGSPSSTPIVTQQPQPSVIAVQKSSFENKTAASLVLGPQAMPSEVAGGNAVAFADFFQDGTYSMVTHSLEYIPSWSTTAFGHIKFYKKVGGAWVDNTSAILKDTTGCLHPRKAVVADFNGDGKPDVFFACHGFDKAPFPGEQPHILFSQQDGTYKNVTLPITCFCHSASAVDYNGNGYADILVTDNMIAATPFFLSNNKDGTFTADKTRLPMSLALKSIFSAEVINFSGKYDVWLGGNEPGAITNDPNPTAAIAPTIIPNDGTNKYVTPTPVSLPTLPAYGLALDIAYANGQIYLLRTNIDNNMIGSFYSASVIQKIDYHTMSSQVVYNHAGTYSNGSSWINWIAPYQNSIIGMDSSYGVSVQ